MPSEDIKLAVAARCVFQLGTGAWFTPGDYLESLIKQVLATRNMMYSGDTHDLVPLQYILVVGLKFSGSFREQLLPIILGSFWVPSPDTVD